MSSPFAEKFQAFIKEKDLIQKGDVICVGVSGGADSICLLQTLYEAADGLGISLCAFHVNHCLRGEESESDQEFVQRFCHERDIPLKMHSFDVASLAKKNKKTQEEMGRIVRRQAAELSAVEFGANKIALAHHLNDSAETLLFNLARGTSLAGLKGISCRTGKIIRPFIIFSREEIENELALRGMSWRTDSTNCKEEYTRNKLRLKVIPYLEENVNSRCTFHMAAAARDIEEAEEIIRELADKKGEILTSKKNGSVLIYPDIVNERVLIAGYILMQAFKYLSDSVTNINRGHVEKVLNLINMQSGRRLDLPHGISAERVYEGVLLSVNKERETNERGEECVKLRIGEEVEFGGFVFESRFTDDEPDMEGIPKKKYTKWFDYDKLSKNLELRYKRSGDYIVVDKNGHRQKLKKYFTDIKLPKGQRDKVVCLACGSRVVWIIGCRIGEDCKVTKDTVRILEVRCFEKT